MGFARNLMAEAGGEIVSDTELHEGRWQSLVILSDTEFSTVGLDLFDNTEALNGLFMYAGTVLYGRVLSFQLNSGLVQAINATT